MGLQPRGIDLPFFFFSPISVLENAIVCKEQVAELGYAKAKSSEFHDDTFPTPSEEFGMFAYLRVRRNIGFRLEGDDEAKAQNPRIPDAGVLSPSR